MLWIIAGIAVAALIAVIVLVTRKKKPQPSPGPGPGPGPSPCTPTSCGNGCACPTGYSCQLGTCVSVTGCTPACVNKTCGSDGCGGVCGTCVAPATCVNGNCVQPNCVPQCDGKVCGDDQCGGLCGSGSGPGGCANNSFECNSQGLCVCASVCNNGKQVCGTDPCGNSCGTCPSGQFCTQGGNCTSYGPGTYNIRYTNPNGGDSYCMYVLGDPAQGGQPTQLAMTQVDPSQPCPQLPPNFNINIPGGFTVSGEYPANVAWQYDGKALNWVNPSGTYQYCINGQCQAASQPNQRACVSCSDNTNPSTCTQMNCGTMDFCNTGYYGGTDYDKAGFLLGQDGSLQVEFTCPDGKSCVSGVCSNGDRCGNIYLAPVGGRPVKTTSEDPGAFGWFFQPK